MEDETLDSAELEEAALSKFSAAASHGTCSQSKKESFMKSPEKKANSSSKGSAKGPQSRRLAENSADLPDILGFGASSSVA